tara:strand:+ start:376 stop:681 length:306 start_codon:yes stop_codon:yes gene_type:complete
MSKSKKPRKSKKKNPKKSIKEITRDMIPGVEKDLEEVFALVDEIGTIDFWSDEGNKSADILLEKAKNIELKIKTKYEGHFDEDEVNSKIPKEYRDHLDSEE